MQTLKEYTNELYEENNTLWEDKNYWKKLAEKRKYQLQQKENIIKEVREKVNKYPEFNYSNDYMIFRNEIKEILDKEVN